MENHIAWRELFSYKVKVDLDTHLRAMASNDKKLKPKIPQTIYDQTVKRGRLSLVGKIQGVRPNIDDVCRWGKFMLPS